PAAARPPVRVVDAARRAAVGKLPTARAAGTDADVAKRRPRAGRRRARTPQPPAKLQPLQPGFIDLPHKTLDQFRRKRAASEPGRTNRLASRLRENCDRVVVLGIGGSYLGAKALFDALCHTYHNEMPSKMRMGKPRIYFEGNNLDNDALQDLLELL